MLRDFTDKVVSWQLCCTRRSPLRNSQENLTCMSGCVVWPWNQLEGQFWDIPSILLIRRITIRIPPRSRTSCLFVFLILASIAYLLVAVPFSPTLFSLALVRQFAPFLAKLGPPWFRRKLVEWTPHKSVQKVMRMSDVMHETATEILERKREDIERTGDAEEDEKDIISILCESNQSSSGTLVIPS